MERKIATTEELLQRSCTCNDLAECGRRILAKRRTASAKPEAASRSDRGRLAERLAGRSCRAIDLLGAWCGRLHDPMPFT
jgi:hypothetical protein